MEVRFTVSNKNKFANQLKKLFPKGAKITVGVLDRTHYDSTGDRNKLGRSKGDQFLISNKTTKEIASLHEFGGWDNGYKIPKRSFIRLPVAMFLQKDLANILKRKKRIDYMLSDLCKKIYERIQEAFDTGGWGQWDKLSRAYTRKTGRKDPPLTDTGQLRGAIYVSYNGKTKAGKAITGGVKPRRGDFGLLRNMSKITTGMFNKIMEGFKR